MARLCRPAHIARSPSSSPDTETSWADREAALPSCCGGVAAGPAKCVTSLSWPPGGPKLTRSCAGGLGTWPPLPHYSNPAKWPNPHKWSLNIRKRVWGTRGAAAGWSQHAPFFFRRPSTSVFARPCLSVHLPTCVFPRPSASVCVL